MMGRIFFLSWNNCESVSFLFVVELREAIPKRELPLCRGIVRSE